MYKLSVRLLFIGLSLIIIGANAGTLTITNFCPSNPIVTVSEDVLAKGCKLHIYASEPIGQYQTHTFKNLNDHCPKYLIGGIGKIARAALNSTVTFTPKTLGICTCNKSNGCL